MVIGLVALVLAPYAWLSASLMCGMLMLACLGLAQSKTTLAIGALVVAAGLAQALHQRLARLALPAGAILISGAAALLTLLGTLLAAALAAGAWMDAAGIWQGLVGDYTGRAVIWDWTLEVWRRHQWFGVGYGSLWSPAMREDFFAIGAWRPGYSHSLYYQTLGESGIVGMVGVVIMALALLAAAWRTRHRGALSVLVIGLLLVRGITEVTWGTVAYSENALIVVFLAAILIADQRSQQVRP